MRFCVARARDLDYNLTAVDEVVGTLDYIAQNSLLVKLSTNVVIFIPLG